MPREIGSRIGYSINCEKEYSMSTPPAAKRKYIRIMAIPAAKITLENFVFKIICLSCNVPNSLFKLKVYKVG
jgi:hypothetical protein